MKLSTKIIIALIAGGIVGLLLNLYSPDLFETLNTYLFTPLGKIFLNLINMLVVPIVFFSITLGTAGLGDPKKLGRIGLKTISYFLATTCMALIIGIAFAYIFQPGTVGTFDTTGAEFQAEEAPPVSDTLLNIIPTNPIKAFTEGNMLQIITFSVFIGFALTMLGEKTRGVLKLFDQGNELMMYLVNLIMRFAPYGTFGLIVSAVGTQGVDAIKAMGLYMGVVLAALIVHTLVTYGSSVYFLAKRNPFEFFKGFAPAMSVAFSTSSSNATLPVSMNVAQKNLKVPESVSSFVQPLGATINMDGTAIMQGVATIFIAQVYGLDLTFTQLVTVVLTAVLASIGTAGVPGVGLIMLAMVLQSVNLPVEGIALIIGIDRLLDMTRTAVNITGDAACAVIVGESEKKKNRELT
ncbi:MULTISPECIES: dicarboxylate/amino acid:cation symporter [Bacillaceae]|uniref:Sodium:dicarboxylate symporter n=2 Tax=Bacillus infantis TaxID=324767 RepID=U5L4Q8_9BACI|nr:MULTISPECIES: dicarboxylate/amino acid:cation symporter [Bacillus]OXT15776.1 dicarboxylate/amino acid:cation symporter [Bacillus sp. OG2]AGX02215.1 sodium:dicarboxylate symporter [Bacillus infantis NRRL B-14911]MCA1037436.1 dicarboxylate/amino acid:cation symporter [Bacillus infantis]MCK6208285.1 dicarboxylate/amino acid:cation symporter [Bacillus infantis]MDW2879356.1 dicarboxylate/amino acid:cation symporter [Bacillus infantis]